ncbi:hypothetical protein [Ruminococcus sp. NK3A76]|uniref:hypothetical protein n=1 Tax=Ruminococcus sp. NK3A76 TaxID=877411 RepID=UPI0012ECB7DB|nr:hypothetical protein [Ruminococcus sp. NK3A76]
MNIIIHLPETNEGIEELNRQVAQCQADMIVRNINKLNTSKSEKEKLLDQVIHKLKQQ